LCSSPHSVTADKIFDGRLIFRCSKCDICSIIPASDSIDEAYLEFLDRVESGGGAKAKDLRWLMEQEKIIRSKKDIDRILSDNKVSDPLIDQVLRSDQDYIVDFRILQEPEPDYGDPVGRLPVDEAIISVIASKGIDRLYKFQQEAVKSVLKGADLVITAPTASGKTEAFCIPVIQKIKEQKSENGVKAIFVYPTKSLSRDQAPKIKEFADPLGIKVAIVDGDIGDEERKRILDFPPEIIVTNFDVIHYHMLHRTRFSGLLRTARFLVVDEAHVYTGVFGANVFHIISRLERLAGKLQIIAASATLPNATEFCERLFGRKMQLLAGRGRRGDLNLSIIFPSLRSSRSLAIDLVKKSTKNDHQTLAFSNSHLGSELLAFYAARQGVSIKVHRAGLTAASRNEVEQLFKSGKLAAISSTPTLELGVDIGYVDTVVSDIVPINRLVQRIGRAARRGQQGYAFLVLGNDPISQYYKAHPDDYLSDHEFVYTDPDNPIVKEFQVLAMACDRPIAMAESKDIWQALQSLVAKGLLILSGSRFIPDFKKAGQVLNNYSIRGIGSNVHIKLGNRLVGERSMPQAIEELHKDAIYFLSGKRYRVKELFFDQKSGRQAYANLEQIPSDYPYYTKALTDEWPSVTEIHERKKVLGIEAAYCSLRILKRVLGYSNMEIGHDITQGKKTVFDSPIEYEFDTKGFVFRAPQPSDAVASADDGDYVATSGFHASEHVIIEGSAMITGGASHDVGGISLGSSGLIFVYDSSAGGNGASRILYDRLEKVFGRALSILSECPCSSESGCPRCTYSYRCGNNNEYLHKISAIEVMKRVAAGQDCQIGDMHGDRAIV
jgi:DEAD/DEAH box helicase domain-containing protein